MVLILRILAVLAVVVAASVPAIAFEGPTKDAANAASAAKAPASANATKAAPATIQAYEAGVKAYQDGKMDLAIRALGTALSGGGLESQKIASALYYRGQAYRKKGKPGLAIADLTSALWLKDGLEYAQRQEAVSARVAAYREAGISDVPQLPSADIMMASDAASSPDGWQTAMANSPGSSSPPVGSVDPQFPKSAPPAPQPQSSSSSSGGGIGGFFSNVTNSVTSLFGGGSSSSTNADDGAVTTASLSQPQASDEASASVASWSGNTQVAAATPSNSATDASGSFVTEVATAPAAANPPSGKYRLQIASVRSRAEADNLAYRLVTEHGGELGRRAPVVDEAVIGSMGTFYRVRVGPYASSSEPQKLCGKLQASGFDCLVVTN